MTKLFANEFKRSFFFNFGLNSFLTIPPKKPSLKSPDALANKGFDKGQIITTVSQLFDLI